MKYSIPEHFPDGTFLELLSPVAFLECCKEIGLKELTELEAACLLRVLTKQELENAIILNELVLIMENFGVIEEFEDVNDDEIDDYNWDTEKKKVVVDFQKASEKTLKILKKLARYLLQRYMHPREFFGEAVYK